jgi:diacylglycerol kinase family enzyme
MPARRKPELAVIVNPNAGRLSDQVRTDVVAGLRARFDVDAYSTTARDTGIELARKLANSGTKIVAAFGGDGHVNEVANGLANSDAALFIIPGGTMNVFARALEIPLDPFGAIDRLKSIIDTSPRLVSLGKMNDRYFTFSAGCGFDAEAAERVERYVPAKRRFGEVFFYWSAFRVLAGSFRNRGPSMTLKGPFGEERVAMAIVSNAGPYAYFVGRAVNIAPEVRLEKGIDVFAMKTMRLEALPFYVWRVAISGDLVDHPDAFYATDLHSFEISADEPFSRHVDGEPLGPSRHARFSIEPDVLKVLA